MTLALKCGDVKFIDVNGKALLMKKLNAFLAFIAVFAVTAATALGHHSFAMFDLTKKGTVKGVVTKVEWTNPHAWIYVDVSAKEQWAVEVGSPAELIRRGWHRTDLKQGDKVSIEGILAKKLPHTANARMILLPNGAKVFNGRAPE